MAREIPNLQAFGKRMERILTFRELVTELNKWLESFPSRGDRLIVVPNYDEEGQTLSGIVGVCEDTVESTFYPTLQVMRLKVEGENK